MKKGKNELLVVFANAVLRNIFLFRNAYVIHNDTMRQKGMMSLLFTSTYSCVSIKSFDVSLKDQWA